MATKTKGTKTRATKTKATKATKAATALPIPELRGWASEADRQYGDLLAELADHVERAEFQVTDEEMEARWRSVRDTHKACMLLGQILLAAMQGENFKPGLRILEKSYGIKVELVKKKK